jgi:polyisoprenoid-binding protein YceI
MKDNKLKGKDFFDVKESPLITFKSTKIIQTGPNTFDIEGNFTIRGVTKTEKLTLTSDSVEVNVRLKWRRVSGPPPVFQQ